MYNCVPKLELVNKCGNTIKVPVCGINMKVGIVDLMNKGLRRILTLRTVVTIFDL